MHIIRRSLVALATIAALLTSSNTFACTGIELKSQDNVFINGRTLEFGIPIDVNIMVIPRNFVFVGTLPDGTNGMSYTTKYAIVGGSLDNGTEVQDGLNETGLSVGTFYFPGYAGYAPVTDANKANGVSPLQFPTWLLSQFSTVDQIKAALNTVSNASSNIVIVPTVFPAWGIVPPLHYVVYDKTGHSIVIEPINGKLVVYDNPLGVMANSPTFDWHMTNLRNYINLSPINVSPVNVNGTDLQQFSQGSGMHGLPGDFTSPSRFVRAAFFTATSLPQPNAKQEVLEAFHILNQFDIPRGAVRNVENGKVAPEYTMFTVVKDPENLAYYYKSYQNQDISVVYLKSFDLGGTTIKVFNANAGQTITDVSPKFVDEANPAGRPMTASLPQP
jgi:choloylglycine hydrolase